MISLIEDFGKGSCKCMSASINFKTFILISVLSVKAFQKAQSGHSTTDVNKKKTL